MAEMAEKVHFEGEHANTMFVKNLFFQDKKKKEKMWVVCAANDTTIDLKALTKKLGCASGNLRAGGEDAMYTHLGARKGALTLFSLINDTNKAVNLIVDKRLTEEFPFIGFHPMVNTATTAITADAMNQIISLSAHEADIIDFAAMATAAPAAPAQKQKPQKQPKGTGAAGADGAAAAQGKGAKKDKKAKKPVAVADADARGITFTKD